MNTFVSSLIIEVLDSFRDSCESSSSESDEDLEFIEKKKIERTKRLDDDVDNFLNEPPRKIPKVVDYFEVVRSYPLDIFRSHFRMSRSAFALLSEKLLPRFSQIIRNEEGGRFNIPLDKRILITIWTLANQESFRGIADRFGLSKSTTHGIFIETCAIIAEDHKNYIQWPSCYKTVSENFSKNRHIALPNIIGAVDGLDVPISAPVEDKISYYNRKGVYSVKVQGICDASLRFLNVFIGFPGACHDAAMWKESDIYCMLKNSTTLDKKYHLIGDSAYPLDLFLMKPYRDNHHLTHQQKKFNQVLSSSRVVIENAFGLLKGKFRRLKYLHMLHMEQIKIVIMAACVLHNFILQQGDTEEIIEIEDMDTNAEVIDEENTVPDGTAENNAANAKRNNLSETIYSKKSI